MTNETATALNIIISADGSHVSLALTGEVDPHTAPRVEGEIRAALLSPNVEVLSLDLSGVTFMDSSGLRVLISTHRSLRERGGRLVLHSPSGTVRRLLEITQLGGEIDIEDV